MSQAHIQKQILYRAIKDPVFAKETFTKIPTNTFNDDKAYIDIALLINRYYQTSNVPLDKETLLVMLEDKMVKTNANAEKQQAFYDTVKDLYTIDSFDQNEDVINENMQKYIRKTLIQQTLLKEVGNGNLEDEDTINNLISKLQDIAIMSAGGGGETINFFRDSDSKKRLLTHMHKNKFKTGFQAIDDIADGGLARGELGLILAPYGGGKTTWAVNLVRNYVMQGLNVLFLPLEEKLDRMVLRFEQVFSQQAKSSLMAGGVLNDSLYEEIQKAYNQLLNPEGQKGWGEFVIAKYMPRTLSPTGLEQEIINQTLVLGKPIDVVIIDYPDLMINPFEKGSDNESRAGGKLTEEIRRIAQEYNFLGWVFSQLNRSGVASEFRSASMIEGSKQKLNPVEIALTINQTTEEQEQGYSRMYVDKLRNRTRADFNRMLPFKYVDETMTLRDLTDQEVLHHQAILEDLEESVTGIRKQKKKEAQYNNQDVQNKLNGMNQALQGGFQQPVAQ